jgi:hypothetical protein
MNRFRFFRFLKIPAMAALLTLLISGVLSAGESVNSQYEVLSPWGDADSRPLKGISSRLDTLSGKRIGLFANYKRAALPIAGEIQRQMKSMFPDSRFTIYHSDQWNVTEIETEKGETFKKWAEGNDAIILLVGD